MTYIIAQILGFVAFFFSLIAFHRKNKNKILSNMIISNVLNLIHYLLLGAYSGCITKVLAIIRDNFIILKDRNKKLSNNIYLILFILIYIIAGIFTYNGIVSILPLTAALIYIIFIWNGKELTIKKVGFGTYFLWLIYNICVLSIPGIISNIVSIISTFIAIISYKKVK
jgi:hypothetical protein